MFDEDENGDEMSVSMSMNKELEFFLFLLEHYASSRQKSADVVLKQWDNLGLTDCIIGRYEQYQRYQRYPGNNLENAFQDIDQMIAEAAAGYQSNQS